MSKIRRWIEEDEDGLKVKFVMEFNKEDLYRDRKTEDFYKDTSNYKNSAFTCLSFMAMMAKRIEES